MMVFLVVFEIRFNLVCNFRGLNGFIYIMTQNRTNKPRRFTSTASADMYKL